MKKSIKILFFSIMYLYTNYSFAQNSYNNVFEVAYLYNTYPDWNAQPRTLGLSYRRNILNTFYLKVNLREFDTMFYYWVFQIQNIKLHWLHSFSLPFYLDRRFDETMPLGFIYSRSYAYFDATAGYYHTFKNRHTVSIGGGVSHCWGEEETYQGTVNHGHFTEYFFESRIMEDWGWQAELQYQYRIYKGITVGCQGGYRAFNRGINEWNYGISLGYAFGK